MEEELEKLGLTSKKVRANLIKTLEKTDKDLGHALKVAKIVKKYDNSPRMIKAALYHDVLESDKISKKDLNRFLDEETIFLIESITNIKSLDINNLPKNPRDAFYAIKVQSTRKLLLSASKDIRVILLKLAEQIANLEDDNLEQWKKENIAKSVQLILAPLADRLGLIKIKNRIQNLAFKTLYPQKYNQLKNDLDKHLEKLSINKQKLENKLTNILNELNLDYQLKGRIKNLYSIKQKIEKQAKTLDQLHDLVGFRILLNTQEDCYQTLGLINKNFSVKTVKDYIANPKPNGYQSIHVIVKSNDLFEFEIQIRTKMMEELAERGPWAHWHYKEQGSTKALEKEIKWFKNLAKKLDKSETKTLEDLKINMLEEKIFVYSPKNEVIELPKNSTPIDYAYAIHSDLGNYLKGAKVNGKLVKLNKKLKNRDKVEIVIDRNKSKLKPTRDWLNQVVTNKAKEHIRKAIK
jgi:RelA/SpoT family (p)ppGpp synthetase